MPRYRTALTATTHLKLTGKLGEGAATWDYTVTQEGGGEVHIVAQDVLTSPVISHEGLLIQVERDSGSIDSAIEESVRDAELALVLLAASARASTGPARQVLTYEVSPGVERRPFVQQWHDVAAPMPKTAVPQERFGALLEAVLTAGGKLQERVILSISWYRRALDEVDAITRFLMLWIALEVLTARLAEQYELATNEGYRSLRRLAGDQDEGGGLISRALGLRRQVLHRFDIIPDELRTEAEQLLPKLESLLLDGWGQLLGVRADYPADSVRPFAVRVVLRGYFMGDGLEARPFNQDPYYTLSLDPKPSRICEDGTVDTDVEIKFTFIDDQGATSDAERQELWGPTGPNQALWKQSTPIVVRAGDSPPDEGVN